VSALLLDTCVLLWWLGDPSRMRPEAHAAIADGSRRVVVSAASSWEMAIKRRLGRIDYPSNLVEVLRACRFEVLDIKVAHTLAVAELPLHHQDPFDRMLVAQAQLEGLMVVTRDPSFRAYGVPLLDA
jgi:PIN domain nuclease of toxin-antitoxin system